MRHLHVELRQAYDCIAFGLTGDNFHNGTNHPIPTYEEWQQTEEGNQVKRGIVKCIERGHHEFDEIVECGGDGESGPITVTACSCGATNTQFGM